MEPYMTVELAKTFHLLPRLITLPAMGVSHMIFSWLGVTVCYYSEIGE